MSKAQEIDAVPLDGVHASASLAATAPPAAAPSSPDAAATAAHPWAATEANEAGEPAQAAPWASAAEISVLLEKTSRTFALAIPLLPEPTSQYVGIAYLLFRIADTFEDAELWTRAQKLEALACFGHLLEHPDPAAARTAAQQWLAQAPCEHQGYLELLHKAPAVLGALWRLGEGPRRLIAEHTRRTVEGMARFTGRANEQGHLQLSDLDDLKGYCYVVAGIVGEMLTELFLLGRKALAPVRGFLRERSARFGEALQLVNIIKDSLADATYGRRFLPQASDLAEIVALARHDLQVAGRYTLSLQRAGAPRGIVAFAALPVRLAQATLDLIEQRGPGAKLSRPDVSHIVAALDRALDEGAPAV